MKIFLDTNVIIGQNFLRSDLAKNFLKSIRFLGIEVIIPEVVIDESVGHFTDSLKDSIITQKKLNSELMALIGKKDFNIHFEKEVELYKNHLDELCSVYNVKILDYPSVSLKEIVVKSYAREKPFKKNGDGYKDYLIWKSINFYIESLESNNSIYFITNNVTDFCMEKEKNFFLHPELEKQLKKQNTIPIVYTSLNNFMQAVIVPLLPNVELSDLPNLGLFDVKEKAREVLEAHDYNLINIGFEDNVSSTIHNIEIDNNIGFIKEDEDVILINISGKVYIENIGYMDKHECYSIHDENTKKNFYIINADWSDHVMLVSFSDWTPFNLTLTFSKIGMVFIGYTIELPEEIIYDY